MQQPAIAIPYNLGRLGNAGDAVAFAASHGERAALARLADILSVERFDARIALEKLSPTRFCLRCRLEADIVQVCVVTLEPLAAGLSQEFVRELQFSPHRSPETGGEVSLSPDEEEGPEEIESLHYDLAGPLIEEFLLALDPYPRAPGVEFTPPGGAQDRQDSPFAALKGLKSRR